jgi:hypothetical protein
MKNTQQPKQIAEAGYTAPDGAGYSLTYGINARGQHVVLEALPAGEDVTGGNIHRFTTVEEARNCWRTIRNQWVAKGYVPTEEYWAARKAALGVA